MKVDQRVYRRVVALSAMLALGAGALPRSTLPAFEPTPVGVVGSTETESSKIPGPVRRLSGRFAVLVPLTVALVFLIPGVLERLVFIGRPLKVQP